MEFDLPKIVLLDGKEYPVKPSFGLQKKVAKVMAAQEKSSASTRKKSDKDSDAEFDQMAEVLLQALKTESPALTAEYIEANAGVQHFVLLFSIIMGRGASQLPASDDDVVGSDPTAE